MPQRKTKPCFQLITWNRDERVLKANNPFKTSAGTDCPLLPKTQTNGRGKFIPKKLSAKKKRKQIALFNKLNKDFIKMGCFLLFFSPFTFPKQQKATIKCKPLPSPFSFSILQQPNPSKTSYFLMPQLTIHTHTHTHNHKELIDIRHSSLFVYQTLRCHDKEKEEKTRACS